MLGINMDRHAEGFIEDRVRQTGGWTHRIGTNNLIRSITWRDFLIGFLSKRNILNSSLKGRRVSHVG